MIDTPDDSGPRVGLNLDERAIRALHSAVMYTLEKWAGEGSIDKKNCLI